MESSNAVFIVTFYRYGGFGLCLYNLHILVDIVKLIYENCCVMSAYMSVDPLLRTGPVTSTTRQIT